MGTKEEILDQALALFNRSGTRAVSTNHIARALGISPGNLYYHYRNKDEILRALFARLAASLSEAWEISIGSGFGTGDLRRVLGAHLKALSDYRFLSREMAALAVESEELRRDYAELRGQHVVAIERMLGSLVAARRRVQLGAGELRALAEVTWMIAFFWLAHAELGGEEAGPDAARRGVETILALLEPCTESPALPSQEA